MASTYEVGRLFAARGAGGNVVVATRRRAAARRQRRRRVRRYRASRRSASCRAAAPYRALFNTHWHLDQSRLQRTRSRAPARRFSRTRKPAAPSHRLLRADEDRYEHPLPEEALPDATFYTHGETIGRPRAIEYGYLLEAHTDGDIYVRFRDANVIAVGDAVSPARDPELDWFGGGWLGGRVDALERLLEISDARRASCRATGRSSAAPRCRPSTT
jgi:cyclase